MSLVPKSDAGKIILCTILAIIIAVLVAVLYYMSPNHRLTLKGPYHTGLTVDESKGVDVKKNGSN